MRRVRLVKAAFAVCVVGVVACSSAAPTQPSDPTVTWTSTPAPAAQTASASAKTALLFFSGEVDVLKQTVNLTVRTPEGRIVNEGTLPYGTGTGDVYFHTCTPPGATYVTVGAGGHLNATVQAVNKMSAAIPDMSVKMLSISDAGTTFSTSLGGGNLYGSVPNTGAATCAANTATWTFTQATTTNFYFYGEADGTAPSGGSGVTFSENYTGGTSPTAQQQADWTTFAAALTGSYTSITISGSADATGKTCTGAVATQLCSAIHTSTAVANVTCNGSTWHYESCCGWEISADAAGTSGCDCSDLYVLRPTCGTFGDVGHSTSCSPPTQTITVNCR